MYRDLDENSGTSLSTVGAIYSNYNDMYINNLNFWGGVGEVFPGVRI
jgi:hypothetical protein